MYYKCDGDKPIRKICESGLWFNVEQDRCTNADSVRCAKYTVTTPNNPDYAEDLDNYVDIGDCSCRSSYNEEVTTTSTLKPETTTLAPNIGSCNIKKDLFENGIYLKSICIFHAGANYDDGMKRCRDNNMNLFIINNKSVESQFYDAVMDLVAKNHPRGWILINGRKNLTTRKWEVYNSDGTVRGPIYNKLKWYSRNADQGVCLRYSGKYSGIYRATSANCNEGAWTTCEHYQKTENPPLLDTSSCLYRRDLYAHEKYLKSVCVINVGLNHDQAKRRCASHQMNLFRFDSEKVVDAFYDNSVDIMTKHPGGHYWINGERDRISNIWYTYHANRTISGVITRGFEWVDQDSIDGKTNGPCLRLSGERGPYQGLGVECHHISWIICEYFR